MNIYAIMVRKANFSSKSRKRSANKKRVVVRKNQLKRQIKNKKTGEIKNIQVCRLFIAINKYIYISFIDKRIIFFIVTLLFQLN